TRTPEDRRCALWNAAAGEPVPGFAPEGKLRGHAFCPGGRTLALLTDRAVTLWDLGGRPRRPSFPRPAPVPPRATADPAFSADGATLVVSDGRALRVWDAASGTEARRPPGHAETVEELAFSADGTRLATAAPDHTVRVWEAASGRALGEWPGPEG